jgi:hypothetical protein
MTTTDWIIDLALILIVLRQIREGRIDLRFIAIPAALCAYTFHTYIHSIPTAGHDLALIIAAVGVGSTLGVLGGVATHVRGGDGHGYARAGAVAAGLWVASMSARLGFILWATSAAGGAALGRFSESHQITSADVWQTALVLLALSEVLVRLAIIVVRGAVAANATRSAGLELASADQRVPVRL